ncbi:MAG: pseudouridine synthase [Bacteroidota bacterium]
MRGKKNEKDPFWKDLKSNYKKQGRKNRQKASLSLARKMERKPVPTSGRRGPEPIRLNRYIARAGVCARREADELISAGHIKVNGKVVTQLGAKVVPGQDQVEYQGKVLRAEKLVYFLYNKPKNTLTTLHDPKGRPTVMEAIQRITNQRVYPVGRLDRNTTGLLVLTNDGQLAKRLTHPSHEVKKLYHVRLNKAVSEEHLRELAQGITLEDGLAKADAISYVQDKGPNEVGIQLHIGRNRIVRRMFEALGYQVEALDRVMIAHLTKKNLPRGRWRELTDKEVSYLKML